jgi:hypothetical protein
MTADTATKPPERLVRVAADAARRGISNDLLRSHLQAMGVALIPIGRRGVLHYPASCQPLVDASLQPRRP